MEPHAQKPPKQNRDRLQALRRHAIAIGALIDDLQPQDLTAWRPGDVAQIREGEPNAGALVRITRINGDVIRGYLLARKIPDRDSPPWTKYSTKTLVRVGHAAAAVQENEYPLREKISPTVQQYAEAARQEYIRHDAAKKRERNERARARRQAKAKGGSGDAPALPQHESAA